MHYKCIFLFVVANVALHTSLLAKEANNPQNILFIERTSQINNYKFDGIKDMMEVPEKLKQHSVQSTTSEDNESRKMEATQLSTTKERNDYKDKKKAGAEQILNKADQHTCQACNEQIIESLQKISDGAFREINWLLRYVGFGILIAIFYMCNHQARTKFAIDNKCPVVFTSLITIFSLCLNYAGCTYQRWKSNMLLSRDGSEPELGIIELDVASQFFWYALNIIVFIAIVSFLFLAYKYFFENHTVYSKIRKNNTRNN